jgi:hypothetical protein
MAALWSGRFADARTHFEQLPSSSSMHVTQVLVAQALYYTGEPARAESLLSGMKSSAPAEQRGRALLASFLAARGARRDALGIVNAVLSHAYQDHHVAYSLGATYVALGRKDEALRWIQQAADTGLLCSAWYLNDPLLAPLRNDPAFAAFISRVDSRAAQIGVEYVGEFSRH